MELDQYIGQLLFDHVLCGVLCSGDVTLCKAPDLWRKWNSGMGQGLHSLQVPIAMRAYYRGAMGILQVYDVTDEASFNNIRNWIRNIEQHASDNVNKILVGNKADMDESKRAVPTSKGQALADEYGIKFFETSEKTNLNVEEVFFSIARDIKQMLAYRDSRAEEKCVQRLVHMSADLARQVSLMLEENNGISGR
ncbi:hypothetical protein RIF29_35094 [Crotalaria pallida]|uniref:Uncharacterized protein n=1 Tax=Crotalaria pallida TaxID=3830 RepID=A0AAN9EBV6_CROPI